MSAKQNHSLHYPLDINDDEALDKDIFKPFNYHTSDINNGMKQGLLKLLGHWMKVPEDKLEKISEIIHYVYNGSLLFDDMQDMSALRRGKPTAHTVYGIPRTIIANDWTYVCNMQLLEELDNAEVSRALVTAFPKLLAGQGMELHWRDHNICPTEAEYLNMIYLKVCTAFLLIGGVMSILSTDKHQNAEKLLTTFGIYFQINDDYKNLRDQMYFDQKGFAEDITEGKFGFPLVHAINNFPEEGKIIKDILKSRTYDVAEKQRCISLVEQCGSFDYTEKKLEELKEILFKEVDNFDGNPALKQFLETAVLPSL